MFAGIARLAAAHWLRILLVLAVVSVAIAGYHVIKNKGKLEERVKQYERTLEHKAKMDAIPESTDAATIDSLRLGTF